MRSAHALLLVCLLLLVTSCSQKPIYKVHDSVFQKGDKMAWAAKELNDEGWQTFLKYVSDGKVFWSRTKIDLLKSPEPFHPYGIQLEVYGEYEVYWDGVLIGKNGNPGQEAELGTHGKLWTTYSIPIKLTTEGEHVLAIRSSLLHFPDHVGIWSLDIDYYDDLLTSQLIETSYIHIFAGAFIIASIYFLFLFLSNKKEYPMLVFGISCFLFFAMTMTQFIKLTVPIHYSLHVVRLEIIAAIMLGISFMIPLYFSMQFPFPKRKVFLGIYAVVLLALFFLKHDYFDFTSNNMALSMWIFSVGIVGYGIYQKMRGAGLVLITLFLSLIIKFISSFGISLFVGFSLILLGMFYLLSIQLKEQQLAYENSLVQSTRLRLELLKKNIQPHFLMNTLTSLIDWIEESPKKGVLFIEALAKEFDLFNQIEDQQLIPISQEIALCRVHMEIMKYRKEINYSWEEEGIDPEQELPPGIIHTLLENGITHSIPRDDNSIKFKLSFESTDEVTCYTFTTFGSSTGKDARKDGTGLRYIKARLTESYRENWEIISEPTSHGWQTRINIYTNKS